MKNKFEKNLLSYIKSLSVYELQDDYERQKIKMFVMSYPTGYDSKTPEMFLEEMIAADKITLGGELK